MKHKPNGKTVLLWTIHMPNPPPRASRRRFSLPGQQPSINISSNIRAIRRSFPTPKVRVFRSKQRKRQLLDGMNNILRNQGSQTGQTQGPILPKVSHP
ncbi:site-specific integrase [Sesbania bispinosa]|nr:site-specific integrase [Sesbania bispinosa]